MVSKQDKHAKLDSGANKLQSHHAGLEECRDSGLGCLRNLLTSNEELFCGTLMCLLLRFILSET